MSYQRFLTPEQHINPGFSHHCTGAECSYCPPSPLQRVEHIIQKSTYGVIRDSLGAIPPKYPTALLPSVTAIIVDRDYTGTGWCVLCHQRADNRHWGFPGGSQHIGESILETVHREVQEETGVHVAIDKLACIDSDPRQGAVCSYPDGNVVQYCNLSFVCNYLKGDIQKSAESLRVEWHLTEHLPVPFLYTHAWRLSQAQAAEVARHGPIVIR